jgi:hypothetical protein
MTARDIRFGLILAMCASYVGPGLLTSDGQCSGPRGARRSIVGSAKVRSTKAWLNGKRIGVS